MTLSLSRLSSELKRGNLNASFNQLVHKLSLYTPAYTQPYTPRNSYTPADGSYAQPFTPPYTQTYTTANAAYTSAQKLHRSGCQKEAHFLVLIAVLSGLVVAAIFFVFFRLLLRAMARTNHLTPHGSAFSLRDGFTDF